MGYGVYDRAGLPLLEQFQDRLRFATDITNRRNAPPLNAAGGEAAGYDKAGEAIRWAYQYIMAHARELELDANCIAIMGGSAGGWASFYHADGSGHTPLNRMGDFLPKVMELLRKTVA